MLSPEHAVLLLDVDNTFLDIDCFAIDMKVYPPADQVIERIGDLCDHGLDWLRAHGQVCE